MAEIIVIIDDEQDLGLLQQRWLKKKGYDTFYASDLSNASDLIHEHTPDLVLLDIHLPDGEGFNLIPQLRDVNPDVKIIMQSAYEGEQEKRKVDQFKADAFLHKPLRMDHVHQTILNVLG